ncbi:M20 family metallopeptidase [Muricoccus radiodurans]|uniref:M20 family metallopeptidase n=1 Tax=Muricoccus radiodurans TaxID=2231721 RepID=UPI003CF7FCD3
MTDLLDFDTPERFLEGLNAWVGIESPTSDAAAVNRVMDRAQADFERIGATVERVPGTGGRGDHLVVRAPWNAGSNERGVTLLSHLDTVHPIGSLALNPIRTEDGRAYGPGINDMKAGAHAGFAALRRLLEEGRTTPLPLTLVYVSDEEVGSQTSQALIEAEAKRSKYVLVLEAARGGGRVVTSRKGLARYDLAVRGVPAHSGSAHRNGRSAVKELAHQILALERMTDYDRGVTVSVGMISGGTAANVVPEHATCSIDLRVPTMADARELTARIEGLAPVTPDVTLTITGGMNRFPYSKPERPDVAALFDHARSLAADIGFDLQDLPSGEGSGGSDGQFCIPYAAVLDGLGPFGGGSHTNGEFLDVSTIVPRGTLLLHLLQTLR